MAEEFRQQGILPDKPLVIDPPGHEKMSEVIGKFIEPYMDYTEDLAS